MKLDEILTPKVISSIVHSPYDKGKKKKMLKKQLKRQTKKNNPTPWEGSSIPVGAGSFSGLF